MLLRACEISIFYYNWDMQFCGIGIVLSFVNFFRQAFIKVIGEGMVRLPWFPCIVLICTYHIVMQV